jgi:arylsulfatase
MSMGLNDRSRRGGGDSCERRGPWRIRAAFVALSLSAACDSGPVATFERVTVQRDLLADLSDWTVEIASEQGLPSFETLTPSYSAYHDSGDLPAIRLPVGTTVSYTIPPEDGPAVLRGAAGVDLSVPRKLRPGTRPLRVRFSAKLDDEVVLDQVVLVHPTENNRKTAKAPQIWHWLGGRAGLEVRGGQTLTLSVGLRGKPRPGLENLRLGFGGLETEVRISTPRTEASAENPNVILIVVDTERADRTSLHGYAKPSTPNLERLAARGVTFDNAWTTSPWTWPSTASILTGMDSLGHGVVNHEACYLRSELPSLPRALQDRGFTSAAFSGNPLIVEDKNFDAGFERFDSYPKFTATTEFMPQVQAWIHENAPHRFFLYLHLVDPHDPHRPLASELERLGGTKPDDYPKKGYTTLGGRLRKRRAQLGEDGFDYTDYVNEGQAAWISDVYDACVATSDVHLGALLDLLEELGLDQKTVIAYTSDHGEELLDRGLTDHAHTLFPELMHVPLVLAGPGIPRGERRAERVSNRHLGTTLALCGGGELALANGLDLLADDFGGEQELLFHTQKGIWNDRAMVEIFGLLEERWALHWAPAGLPYRTPSGEDPGEGQWRLYDLDSDPDHRVDVASRYPEECRRMISRIRTLRAQQAQVGSRFGAGAATRSLLEGIGYIEVPSEGESE